MNKTYWWTNILVFLTFIIAPAFFGFYFLFPDWNPELKIEFWIHILIALGFLLYVTFILFLTTYFKILLLESWTTTLPFVLVIISIYISSNWHISIRILLVVLSVITTWPLKTFFSKLRK